jgi:hypothetical protein
MEGMALFRRRVTASLLCLVRAPALSAGTPSNHARCETDPSIDHPEIIRKVNRLSRSSSQLAIHLSGQRATASGAQGLLPLLIHQLDCEGALCSCVALSQRRLFISNIVRSHG